MSVLISAVRAVIGTKEQDRLGGLLGIVSGFVLIYGVWNWL